MCPMGHFLVECMTPFAEKNDAASSSVLIVSIMEIRLCFVAAIANVRDKVIQTSEEKKGNILKKKRISKLRQKYEKIKKMKWNEEQ